MSNFIEKTGEVKLGGLFDGVETGLINLERCTSITKTENTKDSIFYLWFCDSGNNREYWCYDSVDKRNTEYERIKDIIYKGRLGLDDSET